MIPQHSSKTNEHYTPAHVVEAARALLGRFDLDPASCETANATVKAKQIYTINDDGLSHPWRGKVFLNPPGGKLKRKDNRWIVVDKGPGKSSMQVWWNYLVEQWICGNVTEAFFVAFTLEILRTSQESKMAVQEFPRCYPMDRLRFGGKSPTHANVLVWLPNRKIYREDMIGAMVKNFSEIGLCEGMGDV